MDSTETVSELMARLRSGDHQATRVLFDLLYPELKRLAGARMRLERRGHSWRPTILVNELYLELLKIKSLTGDYGAQEEKEAFFRLAAFLMRRLLIHHSRPLSRRVETVTVPESLTDGFPDQESLVDIDNALDRLAALNPDMRAVVELRVFEGQSLEQIAGILGCSVRTASRHWSFAQRWLYDALHVPGDPVRS